jgi:hypothetical protein
MTCHEAIDKIVESSGEEPLPLLIQLRIFAHLLFCRDCAEKAEQFEALLNIMRADFFPPPPALEDLIMAKLEAGAEAGEAPVFPGMTPGAAEPIESFLSESGPKGRMTPGGLPTMGWVIAGFFILVSLSTSFFGMDFIKVANAQGPSFLLPVGLTIGAVLTGYGALFIGSHLKELSARFRLHG